MIRSWKLFLSQDWLLIGSALLLVMLGLTMIFSSESSTGFLFTARLNRQLISVAVAITTYLLICFFPYHLLRRYAVLIYILGITGLLITFFASPIIRGTTSRFEFAGFQFQTSEFTKVSLVIALSWIFSRESSPSLRTFFISSLLAGVATVLVILEPDVGEAFLLAVLWGGLVVYLGLSWRAVGALALLAILVFTAAWWWYFADYQKQRLLTFLDPASDPLGAGYNVTQSIVALGSGGLLGRGLGHGPQSQLQFLPERHTDFILASIGEELGFVGICLVVILYSILLWRILKIAAITQDNFGQYLAVCAFLLLLFSLLVSAGMNMGLLPVTGIPLPFISYGGSNLVSTFIILGLVQSVHVYGHWVRRPPIELSTFT